MKRLATVAAACCLLFVGACGDDDKSGNGSTTSGTGATGATGTEAALPTGSEPVKLDPADFTTTIDNPYWPISEGKRWTYRNAEEHIVVTRTNRKKTVAGIEAVVLTDVVTKPGSGEYVEVTSDWYAQDSKGNVWYLGEDTKEYENGKVASTKGSWEHGVDGAYAGIIVPADPKPGLEYRQEYYKGEAEDQAKVVRLDAKASVPAGNYENCLETEDTTPLEPDVIERKFYAKGVGPVLRTTAEGRGREELVSFTK